MAGISVHRPRVCSWAHRLAGVALGLGVALTGSRPAVASPVNAEGLKASAEVEGWSASLDGRASVAAGNVDRIDLGFGGGVQFRTFHPPGAGHGSRSSPPGAQPFFLDRWVLVSDVALSKLNRSDITDRGFMHSRYTRMWLPRVGSDFFAQAQYNAFTRLRTRILGGTGIRVDAVHRRRLQLWGGSGYMAEFEVNAIVEGDSHPREVINHRWTSYLVVQAKLIDDQLVVRNTVYAQPRFDAFEDVRMLESVQVEARLGKVFALGVDFELQFDNRPPDEVESLDLRLGSYVRFRFG